MWIAVRQCQCTEVKKTTMIDKPKQGRPPKPPEQIAHQVSIRLTPARKVKYLALGGNAWLNKAIDRAKVKGDQ